MRTSQFLLSTLKEAPSDAETVSHRLMLRAGMIRKLASGLYTWLPLGLRVLKKVEAIVREEMNRAGGLEILMPAVQPAELWQETGRWDRFGPQLLKIVDRHERPFCFGPTHEEVITDLARRELKSYKQLPLILYQIQTKFRDEIRPRFGVMRAREFLMKDAYSFHLNEASMLEAYQCMYETYSRIFTRLGLNFRAVLADTGSIGGKQSHEFHVLAESGEDEIYYSNQSDYAANVELAPSLPPEISGASPTQAFQKVPTPNVPTIESLANFLKVEAKQILKTLIVVGAETPYVALLLRGDHELNLIKAEKLPQIAKPLQFAAAEEIKKILHCEPGYYGPIQLDMPIIADHAVLAMRDFVCGPNESHQHFIGVNWDRDLPRPTKTEDLRKVVSGDPSPDGQGELRMARGIEVGHIFQLRDTYSKAMDLTVLDEQGNATTLFMGTYGIGVSRITAAAIEQNYDEAGICWPESMAPFQIALISLNLDKSAALRDMAEKIYHTLREQSFDVLWDDRKERPGVMFADMELIGIPHHLILSERGLAAGTIEYKARKTGEKIIIPIDELISLMKERCGCL